MLKSEFEQMTGEPESGVFERANAIYEALPTISKESFCLLFTVYRFDLGIFREVEKSFAEYETLKSLAQIYGVEDVKPIEQTRKMHNLDQGAKVLAIAVAREMMHAKYWTRTRLEEVRKNMGGRPQP